MAIKLTRPFQGLEPKLQTYLIRLTEEIERALVAQERALERVLALVSQPTASASYCIAHRTYAGSTTEGAVAFSDTDIADTDDYHDPSSDNTRFVVPEDGDYEVTAWVGAQSTLTVTMSARLRLDGTTTNDYPKGWQAASALNNLEGVSLNWSGTLTAGQYFEVLSDVGSGTPNMRAIFCIKRLDR